MLIHVDTDIAQNDISLSQYDAGRTVEGQQVALLQGRGAYASSLCVICFTAQRALEPRLIRRAEHRTSSVQRRKMIFSFGITLTDREPMAVVLGCYLDVPGLVHAFCQTLCVHLDYPCEDSQTAGLCYC